MSGMSPTQLVLLVGVLIIIALMMFSSVRRHRRGGPDPRAYARDQIARLKDQKGIKDDLQQLVVELHDAARRLNAQMDTKSAKLEALITDADERIRRLSRTGRGESSSGEAGSAASSHGVDVVVDEPLGGELSEEPPDPVHHRVLTLGARGLSSVEIARETGVKPGEVELILALHAGGTSGGGGSVG